MGSNDNFTEEKIEGSDENIQTLICVEPFEDCDSLLYNGHDVTGETKFPNRTYTLLNESTIVLKNDDVDDSLNDINNSEVINVRNELNMPIPEDQITVSDDLEDDSDSDLEIIEPSTQLNKNIYGANKNSNIFKRQTEQNPLNLKELKIASTADINLPVNLEQNYMISNGIPAGCSSLMSYASSSHGLKSNVQKSNMSSLTGFVQLSSNSESLNQSNSLRLSGETQRSQIIRAFGKSSNKYENIVNDDLEDDSDSDLEIIEPSTQLIKNMYGATKNSNLFKRQTEQNPLNLKKLKMASTANINLPVIIEQNYMISNGIPAGCSSLMSYASSSHGLKSNVQKKNMSSLTGFVQLSSNSESLNQSNSLRLSGETHRSQIIRAFGKSSNKYENTVSDDLEDDSDSDLEIIEPSTQLNKNIYGATKNSNLFKRQTEQNPLKLKELKIASTADINLPVNLEQNYMISNGIPAGCSSLMSYASSSHGLKSNVQKNNMSSLTGFVQLSSSSESLNQSNSLRLSGETHRSQILSAVDKSSNEDKVTLSDKMNRLVSQRGSSDEDDTPKKLISCKYENCGTLVEPELLTDNLYCSLACKNQKQTVTEEEHFIDETSNPTEKTTVDRNHDLTKLKNRINKVKPLLKTSCPEENTYFNEQILSAVDKSSYEDKVTLSDKMNRLVSQRGSSDEDDTPKKLISCKYENCGTLVEPASLTGDLYCSLACKNQKQTVTEEEHFTDETSNPTEKTTVDRNHDLTKLKNRINKEKQLLKTSCPEENTDLNEQIMIEDKDVLKYMTGFQLRSAPLQFFDRPFPAEKNLFVVGEKLEGIDPKYEALFCVMTVSEVCGYRIQLHFDGFGSEYDFWVNADCPDLFHAGWCELNSRILQPPCNYRKVFDWTDYLRECQAVAAPKCNFVSTKNLNSCKNPHKFQIGGKLEALDKLTRTHSEQLIYVATIADILGNRIRIHFDGWPDDFDYWADITSNYIHPIGWCEKNGRTLFPPKYYKAKKGRKPFNWTEYLAETKSEPVPEDAFVRRPLRDFCIGMVIEVFDLVVPKLLRISNVVDVRGDELKIVYDGFDNDHAYWIEDDSPDIHPVGWSSKINHPIELPPASNTLWSCNIHGCKGYGNSSDHLIIDHVGIQDCPYEMDAWKNAVARLSNVPDRLKNHNILTTTTLTR